MVRIMAIDPGVTTGVAVSTRKSNKEAIDHQNTQLYEVKLADLHTFAKQLARNPPQTIIIEEFQLNPGHSRGGKGRSDLFSPIHVAAYLEAFLSLTDLDPRPQITYQLPAEKALFKNDRLQLTHPTLYQQTRGKPHARDALRHLLVAARRLPK
jgi:hypothetical protein